MMFRKTLGTTALTLLLAALSITAVLAQGACPALVEQALTAMGDNCTGLERNSACYGYNQVEATFAAEVPADYFSQPSDRADLTSLSTIRTAALDLVNDRWGVAVMSVQANLPNTLPGQAVTFLLMGDAELTNEVDPEVAFIPADALPAQTLRATALHVSPTVVSQVVMQVAAGIELLVDGHSVDNQWMRATVDELVGWVPLLDLTGPNLETLPILRSAQRTPMQAFYFSTGIGQPECTEAQSVVAVQSPENLQVELTVNGVDIRVGSTVTFQSKSANTFIMTVHEGEVVTSDGQVIPAGYTIEGTVDENGNIIGWTPVREATPEEKELGQQAIKGYAAVGIEVQIVDDDPDAPITQEIDGEIIHIVQPRETLFSIARLYNTGMVAIMNRNGIVNPAVLFVGQRLVIPNPGSGFVGLPPELQPPAPTVTETTDDDVVPVDSVSCAEFRPTSPLDGMEAGLQTFYWDAAPGATGYRLRIFNNRNAQVFEGSTTETSLTVDTSAAGLGDFDAAPYSWTVEALANGVTACRSAPVTTQREWPHEPPVPERSFVASMECLNEEEAMVTWSGAADNAVITIKVLDWSETETVFTFSGSSGREQVSVSAVIDLIVVSESVSGQSINVGDCTHLWIP